MKKIALVGNPNSGKTTLFNQLTGLHQKVGNYPGVTVDKVKGITTLNNEKYIVIDLPGTYSIYPTSGDEKEVVKILGNPNHTEYPDLILFVADINLLDRHLLLFTQIQDLKIPTLLCLNMLDTAKENGVSVDITKLEKELDCSIVPINAREKIAKEKLEANIDKFKIATKEYYQNNSHQSFLSKLNIKNASVYQKQLALHFPKQLNEDKEILSSIQEYTKEKEFSDIKEQIKETLHRFTIITPLVKKCVLKKENTKPKFTDKIDKIITHPVLGFVLFFLLMAFVFQSIFSWSSVPMDFIDSSISGLNEWLKAKLPDGLLTSLLTDGLVAGIGSVIIFVPQIAILFFLLALLEEVGYMSRAVYLFDRFMQKFGLNGRSIVALISGSACAIPAIMATRTISNKKERLLTILVTPFVSCSARIPVYVLLVGMAVTPKSYFGFVNAQGIAVMGLYALGFIFALGSSLVLKFIIKQETSSFLALELPKYKTPSLQNVLFSVKEKVVSFLVDAGKIILILSIVIWGLSSFGPGNSMDKATEQVVLMAEQENLSELETQNNIASKRLENSYIGYLGKSIEPLVSPLGYDWKIGISLITSFAAREVFVSTMSTLNSLGSEGEELSLQKLLSSSKHKDGSLVFTNATIWSLLIFYVLAMQCMGTLAVVKRETNGWKWPIIQLVGMTVLAYISAFITYQILQ